MGFQDIIQLRQELHSKPELSNQEYKTAEMIKSFVAQHEPTEIIEGIGGTGLAVVYEFPDNGKTITIRCELDALPIQEENQFPYQSTNHGVSHKCGHDGHMAILASLVYWLKNNDLKKGKVVLLFQPAEENGQGAERVLKDEKFIRLETDYLFALHNIPKEPLNHIIIMDKGFSAEVQSFVLTLNGKDSHAAEPENGINPSMAISEIIQAISTLQITDPNDESFAIVTPVHIKVGKIAYGISPGNGEIHYTIRTWDNHKMNDLKAAIKDIVNEQCAIHGLEYEFEWLEYFPASLNNQECNHVVRIAAKENGFQMINRDYPFKFGEDFGWFSSSYKTTMFGLGSGLETPALHNANYDFPDEIIPTGHAMFSSIISNLLQE